MLFFCIKSALLYHLLSTKCAPSVSNADFADFDSACHWPLGVVCGPAHGPRADVVELAAGARSPVLVDGRPSSSISPAERAPARGLSAQQEWCRGPPLGGEAAFPGWR